MAKETGNLLSRDEQAQEMRRAKKKGYVKKGNVRESFAIEKVKRKTLHDACDEMRVAGNIAVFQKYENRKFSIRAWDKNGDELWNENEISVQSLIKDWSFMKFWSENVDLGGCIEVQRNTPVKANFYFRRVF